MIIRHFFQAFKGFLLWIQLKKKYSSDVYIVMPHSKEEYNYYALLYLDEYIKQKKYRKVSILTYDNAVLKSLYLFTKFEQVKAYYLSPSKINNLLKYYSLYEFTTKISIISLKKPYDTYGENLIGIHGVTKRELLCYDIYRFNDIPKVTPPVYYGNDKEIKQFMR